MRIAGVKANRVNLANPSHHQIKVWNLPNWSNTNPAQRMAVLRQIATVAGRNPQMATLAVSILKKNNVKPRDYHRQAEVLLKYVQDEIFYINEPSERLQDPFYTLKVGYGDCDDMILLYHALLESINLKWKFVLVAKENNRYLRWIEGDPLPPQNRKFAHIYGVVGNHPFTPTKWTYAEPTLKVPFGWDIVNNSRKSLAEFGAIEEKKSISQKIVQRLKPTELIPNIIVGSITGILASYFTIRFIVPILGDPKKRKK